MKTKKVSFNFKNKEFIVEARECSIFNAGLMFRTRNTIPCLFEFDELSEFDITSLFVFFPFVAVWLNSKNEVIDTRLVKPFTIKISCKDPFAKLLEIPVNDKNKSLVRFLVDN